MDIDAAIDAVQQAPDVPAISDTLIALLNLVSVLDDDLARLRQRVQALERETFPTIDQGARPHAT